MPQQWRNSPNPFSQGMSETLNYFAVEPQSKSYPSYGDIVNVMNNVAFHWDHNCSATDYERK